MIVPIGVQCLNAILKKRLGISEKSLPFDWMLSNPGFVLDILSLLLDGSMSVDNIVSDRFFCCDGRVKMTEVEHFVTDHSGGGASLYNSRYDVVFPHDQDGAETRAKYARRLTRLRQLVLSGEPLVLLYSSQSSLTAGNFTIDGREILSDVYRDLTNIFHLVGRHNPNTRMVVFDAVQNEPRSLLDPEIEFFPMAPSGCWTQLILQIQRFLAPKKKPPPHTVR
jgi:hypothetical protein